jgi:proteic killer suppression protein
VIQSFRDKDTEALFAGRRPRRFRQIERIAQRKLLMLNEAKHLPDLGGIPGNRLEKLSGNRAGAWSIRINDQWRVCFTWRGGDAHDVEIVDYH